ncbi:hypothetical protein [Ferrimonas balearica]|nr:hypothetical protein [Ferrimonas balearica]MBW3138685.1 hypothetical protein [Ferrimonas balearica]MBW3163714.1 hypothetical protein [Ferrimonas balearica]MBY6095468.1 hypothetical protein [Ferrimonas balearica]MBY6105746.1 hypothetical protein [Ferrimonas balearica]
MRPLILLCLSLFSSLAFAGLDPHLSRFAPYLDKTWRGEFANSTPERPMVDVSRWESALQGKAIRIRHSLNQGEYEGETLIIWNAELGQLEFFYFTTGGFYTRGVAQFDVDGFVATEQVTGSDEGITEVRARVTLNQDGSMSQSSRYLKQGKWVDGHSVTYYPVE